MYTRSGRDALRLVASFLKKCGHRRGLAALLLLRVHGVAFPRRRARCALYRVLEEFRIDLDDVDAMAAKRGRVALLYMH